MNIIQKIKKYVVSSATVILFVVYVVYQRISDVGVNSQNKNLPVEKTISTISVDISNVNTPTTSVTITPVTQSTGLYKDGVYNGSVVFVYDSDLQVQAVVKNGKLSDIKFLIYPDRTQYSREVANESTPTLIKEAIQAQSVNIDAVSGATYTSASFKESLASALVLAKK